MEKNKIMEAFSLDNILTDSDITSLFMDQDSEEVSEEETQEEQEETTEVNVEDLFDEPESVGSEEDNKEAKEDTTPSKSTTSSPNTFSSIAKAFAEEGIFPNLEDEEISSVTSAEEFRALIDKQIQSELDERQKRIDQALGIGVEPNIIKYYENTIAELDNVKDEHIEDEGDRGENLRKNLIYQDFINRGYSKERATREVQKSFNAGTDVEDAKEALKSAKDYFNAQYKTVLDDAKKVNEQAEAELKAKHEELRKSILDEKKVFGDLELDKNTRQRIYESVAKPIYKDPDTGMMLSSIQKYEKEHTVEFLKYVGLCYTLTDGFKNLDGLVKGKVRKEVKKGFKELENTLNNTARTSDGNLKFTSGVDSESIFRGWSLDV